MVTFTCFGRISRLTSKKSQSNYVNLEEKKNIMRDEFKKISWPIRSRGFSFNHACRNPFKFPGITSTPAVALSDYAIDDVIYKTEQFYDVLISNKKNYDTKLTFFVCGSGGGTVGHILLLRLSG